MFVSGLLVVGFVLILWLVWEWSRVRRHWAELGVPHDPPHPLLGSLTFLQKENMAFWLRRLNEKFRSPYCGVWLFWRPALVINCPELARKVLVKDSDNFRNRLVSSRSSDPIGALNIFTVNEPIWSSVRRRLTVVFTAAKLRNLEGLIVQKVDDLIHRYKKEMDTNPKEINVRMINSDYTTDVIGEAAFGVRSEALRTGDSAIRRVTRDFMHFSVYRGFCWTSIFFFPSLVDFFGFSLFPKSSISFLRQLFRSIISQRGGYDKPVQEPRDLLDTLLKMRQDAAKDNEEMSEDLLLAQATVFLQAGFDTTGASLTWLFKELAHAPHVQEKLYQEIVETRERLGKELDAYSLAEMPYLNAVIKETIRKYPPMGWLDRIASNDYHLDDSLTIPAGTPVFVNAVGMHWDPENFPQPEEFRPERFLSENQKDIKPYTFIPFGEGPRVCIGMRFAYLSMRYAVEAVVRNFSIRPPADAPPPNEWPVERYGLFYVPVGKMELLFTSRP